MKTFMKNYVLILVVGMCFYSCNDTPKTKVSSPSYQYTQPTSIPYNQRTSTTPNIGSSSGYKYNSRDRGTTGEYNYNYDVSGYGEDGYVTGNIDIEGKYGSGYLEDEDGNEIEIDVEWVDYGELEATDENGNTYELEVD